VTVTENQPRTALLDAVIESIARHGLGARSLRDLAADAGTSHRMLIHHFGSRDGLLVAIVGEVESRQRVILESPPRHETAIEAMWTRLAGRELWPFERLFFECYARGAQGESPFDRLLPALVNDWLALFPRGRTRDRARLAVAVVRGLLLDLVATEDRAGVDRAMREFVSMAGDHLGRPRI
jgi:AcrR family transcriptional regulator